MNLDDGDNLVKLLADLFQRAVVADDYEGHSREAWVFSFADGETVDVVAARGEQPGDLGENADRKSVV